MSKVISQDSGVTYSASIWIGHEDQFDALDKRSDMIQYIVVDERYDVLKLVETLLEEDGIVKAFHVRGKEVNKIYIGRKSSKEPVWEKRD